MAQSEVEIYNTAFIWLGQETVTAVTDPSKRAIQARVRYKNIRNALLQRHNWRFAIGRATLAPETAAPEFGWTYQYLRPIDCLRILNIKDYEYPWIREGKYILTDVGTTLYLNYIREVEAVLEFDPVFAELLGIELAMALCYSLTGSMDINKEILAPMRTDLLSSAAFTSAIEGWPDDQFVEGSWVSDRR